MVAAVAEVHDREMGVDMSAYSMTIDGESVSAGELSEIRSPATDEVVGSVPIAGPEQVAAAIAAARAAQTAWAATPDAKRCELLMRCAEVFEKESARLAELITREQGKPLGGPGSMFEMGGAVAWTQVPASLELPTEVVFEDDTRRDEVRRRPLGVVGAIAPWNWPVLIAVWQIVPAVRMGNTVVIKPSELTPIATLELVRLMNTVLPPGVVNAVSGDGEVGRLIVESPDVDKVMFTGSVETGKEIMAASADNLTRLTLELGGNDAAIVLPDVDAQAIAPDLFWGAFINMGQTCACAKRLFVHDDVYDDVVAALDEVAANIAMGNGLDEGVMLGPVQNRPQFDKVRDLVDDARQRGATIVRGGEPVDG
ncbi:MAG: aldehyde dehydrogenase family protein, partial [Acidimicrobiales bacterium]